MKFDNKFNCLETDGVHIKLWLSELEDGAMQQLLNLSKLPFAFHHICAMPDAHQGYGMPIGGVLATKGAVIPNAVGVDIGCGVCCVKTARRRDDVSEITLRRIMCDIRKLIPLGFKHHKEAQDENLMPCKTDIPKFDVIRGQYKSALKQLGTLGGGNHFIEIQQGDDGFIYIMIHSGSRNLGKQVADHYNKLAIELNKRWHSNVPKEHELAFFPASSEQYHRYMDEMKYCVAFARASRILMMNRAIEAVSNHIDCKHVFEKIDVPHNYAELENHYGKNVVVHRKGATKAYEGEIGLIPGSQGTSSYIVKGKGNPESFKSCSHGAGRLMGRKEARRSLSLEEETKRLNDLGIIHSIRNKDDLDEAAGAYKDIDEVMSHQEDLVDIVTKLSPIAVIKA